LAKIRANGHPAVAAHLRDRTGEYRGYGIMVLTITGFPDPALFLAFGLPTAR
jgi:hypothetical protein